LVFTQGRVFTIIEIDSSDKLCLKLTKRTLRCAFFCVQRISVHLHTAVFAGLLGQLSSLSVVTPSLRPTWWRENSAGVHCETKRCFHVRACNFAKCWLVFKTLHLPTQWA